MGHLERIEFDKIKSTGYAFQIEVSHHVKELGGAIGEIPILFVERTAGSSKMSSCIMLEGIYLILKLTLKRLKISVKIFK